jgi:hypothetical protein
MTQVMSGSWAASNPSIVSLPTLRNKSLLTQFRCCKLCQITCTSAFKPGVLPDVQGLDSMVKHKSRLEREKEAAAAKQAGGTASPGQKPLPSYMRATAASIAMEKVCNQSPKIDVLPCPDSSTELNPHSVLGTLLIPGAGYVLGCRAAAWEMISKCTGAAWRSSVRWRWQRVRQPGSTH